MSNENAPTCEHCGTGSYELTYLVRSRPYIGRMVTHSRAPYCPACYDNLREFINDETDVLREQDIDDDADEEKYSYE